MTEEKLLAYLNLKKEIDRTIMKISFWFDLSFTIFIIICEFVFKIFSFNLLNFIWLSAFLISDVFFYVWCRIAKNPTQEISFLLVVSITSVLKLLFAFTSFCIVRKQEIFSWIHFAILLSCIFLSFWQICSKFLVLQDLKKNSIEIAQKNVQKRKLNRIFIPFSSIPSIAVILFFLYKRSSLVVSIEFCFWGLACVWLFIVIICLYNYIIVKKYKVSNIFCNKQRNTRI